MEAKEFYKKLGDDCFNHLKELNPNGNMKDFIRMSVEYGYKKNQTQRTKELIKENKKLKKKVISSMEDVITLKFEIGLLEMRLRKD